MVSRNSIPVRLAYIWQSKWLGIIAIKTESTQINFLRGRSRRRRRRVLDLKVPVLWRTWTYDDDEFSFLFLNLNKILKNSTPGKVACIWHIERVQIDAIKFERTQIHFLPTFSLPSSSSLLKVSNYNSRPRHADLTLLISDVLWHINRPLRNNTHEIY